MIDIHAHILPGIDDGAEDIYETLEMAKMAADSGVTAIVATPHCNIPGMFDNYFGKKYIERYQMATEAVHNEGIPVKILPGMEVFATEDLPELISSKKIMPVNQSRYILVEFPFDAEPGYAFGILKRMKEIGAIPVVAHAERYHFVQDNPHVCYQWRKRGYAVQVNKGSFEGRFGRTARKTVYRMLSHNMISVIASDAHGYQQRTPYLKDVYEKLSAERSPKYMDVLFRQNPARICGNKPLLKIEPIPFSKYEL
ncbi:MAG: tyrosine-protein phosphatase [Dorea sp.]